MVVDGVEGPIELVVRGGGRTWWDAWWATLARFCGRVWLGDVVEVGRSW